MGLNEDFTVMFKPVKRFTKKQIKGLDKHDLAVQQIEDEEERRKKGNKEVPAKPKRISLKKADGRVVGLDDYENDILW